MEAWNARSWTLDTLTKKFGQTTVHVELSRWNSAEKRWADFRDLYRNKNQDPVEGGELFLPHHPMLFEDFIEIFLKQQRSKDTPLKGYLAQQQLLNELPSMAEGIL